MFISIPCERLNNLVDEIELVSESQTGLRKGYSTIDNMFIVDFLSKYPHSNKKKLHRAFILSKHSILFGGIGYWGRFCKVALMVNV